MTCYKIVRHRIFEYQYEHLDRNSLLKRQVDTQLRAIDSDPANAGTALQGLPPDLAGKVKKLKVGGRKGYRMIIKTNHYERVVKIIFITSVKREHIDYKKLLKLLPYLIDLPEDQVEEKTLKKFIIN